MPKKDRSTPFANHDEHKCSHLHVLICDPAFDAIDDLCIELGCTRPTLIDAVGHLLADPDIRAQLLASEPLIEATKWARQQTALRRRRPQRVNGPTPDPLDA